MSSRQQTVKRSGARIRRVAVANRAPGSASTPLWPLERNC